jgi:tetratricopeptide (TPR) repeat protein
MGFVHAQPESALEGETEWSFHHILLREVTYESVLKRERQALHKAAAGWLRQQAERAGRLDEFAGMLAEHSERAGELDEAAGWHLRAGERSFERGAPREAAAYFDRALDLTAPVERERRWRALLGRGDAAMVLGDIQAWHSALEALLNLAAELDDPERLSVAYERKARALMLSGDCLGALPVIERALAAARRAGHSGLEALALARKGQALALTDEAQAGINCAKEALALARPLGVERTLADVLYRAAFCWSMWGDAARAVLLLEEHLALARRIGTPYSTDGMVNLGSAYLTLGLYREARSVVQETLSQAERYGQAVSALYARGILAGIALDTGDLRGARRMAERALSESEAVGDARARRDQQALLGSILLEMGDAGGAARRFEAARQEMAAAGLQYRELAVSARLACARVRLGQAEEAGRLALSVWQALEPRLRAGQYAFPEEVCTDLAEVFDATDEPGLARAALEAGHAWVMVSTERISNPAWRRSYLENVPPVRKLVEMMQRIK